MARLSAKQRKMRREGKQSRFILLPWGVKRSKAYHSLSPRARAALLEIIDRYDGQNNGRIGLGVRELAYELNCSPAQAWRALRELEDSGLIIPRTLGAWRGKRATEWPSHFTAATRPVTCPRNNGSSANPTASFTHATQKFHRRKMAGSQVSPMKRIGLKSQ